MKAGQSSRGSRLTGESTRGALTSFSDDFASALDERNLSLSRLRVLLQERGHPVPVATLSYWRSGARRPEGDRSMATVAAIEEILAVGQGRLTRHLVGKSRRIGTVSALADPDADDALIRDMQSILNSSPAENMRTLSIQETITVDDRGAVAAVTSLLLLQCVTGRVDRLGYVQTAAEPTEEHPQLTRIVGGSCDLVHVHPSGRAVGFAISLATPLQVGETAMVEATMIFPRSYPVRREHQTFVRRPVRELIQWFRFSSADVPTWCDEVETVSGVRRTREVALDTPISIHRVRSDFGPGSLRLRWGYDDDFPE
ncbi:hypothetical protein [Psychromicrobium xiongbiense]|uniref:hypothetical protein n=1 Tax=Psychromicrobium xiongbiense TaxID=3051184 RepID=UPI00255606FA|nr:hypothetical protein [Psychromicrobium sp. YIM S02556]